MAQVISQPDVTVNILAANTLVPVTDQRVLFIGQKVAAGTSTSGALDTNIQNDNSWDALYGSSSMLAGMLRDARALNQDVRFDAISLDDASGTPAEGTITIVGIPSEDGTIISPPIISLDGVFFVYSIKTTLLLLGKVEYFVARTIEYIKNATSARLTIPNIILFVFIYIYYYY